MLDEADDGIGDGGRGVPQVVAQRRRQRDADGQEVASRHEQAAHLVQRFGGLEVMQHGDHGHGVEVGADHPVDVRGEAGEEFSSPAADIEGGLARLRQIRDDPVVEVIVVIPRMPRVEPSHHLRNGSPGDVVRPPPQRHGPTLSSYAAGQDAARDVCTLRTR
ncbi:hypothetical protein [uncultured Jatrophihabitans sp.]|uniref:hypothetical protein n=1 Tax=uncultured Jatrophihabitans sp. TaxID=1610747 RepID=UPI0035CBEAE9